MDNLTIEERISPYEGARIVRKSNGRWYPQFCLADYEICEPEDEEAGDEHWEEFSVSFRTAEEAVTYMEGGTMYELTLTPTFDA